MTASRRDANEPELVAFWRQCGAVWIPQDRTAGFDGMLFDNGRAFVVEIKNPCRRWELTEAEQKRKAEMESVGVCYNIVETHEDAFLLLNCK